MLYKVFQVIYLSGRILANLRTLQRDIKEVYDLLGLECLFDTDPDTGQDL